MNGELIVVDDVPGEFAERVIEAFHARPGETFSFALSGGDTARRCYERLAADGAAQIDWWQVDVYWGDERCVPPDHADSNERLGREALLERVGAANAVYPMRCDEGRLVAMNHDPSDRNPHERVTLTFSGIARSRLALVTVEGAEKRTAFEAVRRNDPACPASRIRAERVVWLVDRAAAGE